MYFRKGNVRLKQSAHQTYQTEWFVQRSLNNTPTLLGLSEQLQTTSFPSRQIKSTSSNNQLMLAPLAFSAMQANHS